jgi:threonine/homoserine/homoserine lactone efflux protein
MNSAMQNLLAAAGLITVAASTPGPNNFIVMRAAATNGLLRTLPLVVAIVVGSLAMLALVSSGSAIAVAEHPALGAALALVGGAYLIFLGLSIAWHGVRDCRDSSTPASHGMRTPLGLFCFQLLNPKGWLMIVTAVSSGVAFTHLAIVIGTITTCCLLVWSWFGSLLHTRLQRPRFARWFHFLAGSCLAGSALMVIL